MLESVYRRVLNKERRFPNRQTKKQAVCKPPLLEAEMASSLEDSRAISPFSQRLATFLLLAFAGRLPREAFFAAPFGPRKTRAGRSIMAARLNFRAARRAPSFPPYPLSLNNLVTVSLPRRKCT